jgi:hypothetical protein
MHSYYDKWGCEVIEKMASFNDDGGYKITISIIPKTFVSKILYKLNFSLLPFVAVEICEDFRETITVSMKRDKKIKNKYAGIFFTTAGMKILKISIDPKTLKSWKVNSKVERLYS